MDLGVVVNPSPFSGVDPVQGEGGKLRLGLGQGLRLEARTDLSGGSQVDLRYQKLLTHAMCRKGHPHPSNSCSFRAATSLVLPKFVPHLKAKAPFRSAPVAKITDLKLHLLHTS